MRQLLKSIFAVTSITLLVGLSVNPAQASEIQNQDVFKVLTDLTASSSSPSTSVLGEVADASRDQLGTLRFESKENQFGVRISSKSDIPIEIATAAGSVTIEMPFAKRASSAKDVTVGVVAFDNGNGSVNVPIIKRDGSLQLTVLLFSSSSPTRYDYKIGSSESLKIVQYGRVPLVFMNGKFVGAVAPAWAKDAKGRDVPSHFEVSGTTITQVVDHQSGAFSYPIVADPWLGINLFSSVYLAPWTYLSQPVVNLNLSSWGWLVYSGVAQGGLPAGFALGQAILDTAGWDEAWGKGGAIRSALDKPSQRQQFSCHALGALAAGEWNLEKGRPNRLNGNWGAGVAVHHCNWKYAEGSQTD